MYTLLPVDIQILSFQNKRLFIVLLEWKFSRSVVSDSLPPHGLQPTRLLRPRDFPGGSTGVGCHFLLQRIFPTQRLNPGLSQCRPTLYHLSHQESSLIHVLLPFWWRSLTRPICILRDEKEQHLSTNGLVSDTGEEMGPCWALHVWFLFLFLRKVNSR